MAGGPGGHIPDFAVIEKRTEAEIENLPQLRAFLFSVTCQKNWRWKQKRGQF